MPYFYLHDAKKENGLRKITWASGFHSIFKILCLYLHVSLSMSPCPCLHVHVSMSPFLHVSMSHVYVSMFPSLHLHVSMFPEFRKQKMELTENGNGKLPFICCNGNGKWKFVILGRQTINGNRRFLFQQTCPSKCIPMFWLINCFLRSHNFYVKSFLAAGVKISDLSVWPL